MPAKAKQTANCVLWEYLELELQDFSTIKLTQQSILNLKLGTRKWLAVHNNNAKGEARGKMSECEQQGISYMIKTNILLTLVPKHFFQSKNKIC